MAPDAQSGAPPHARVGCAGLPPGLSRARYFERLAYLETTETLDGLPGAGVLAKWRTAVPDEAAFGLVAPRIISHRPGRKGYGGRIALAPEQLARAGGFRDTDVVREAVAALADAAATVRAHAVVFCSPAELSPSAANREQLRRFFAEIAPAERFPHAARVWRPDGLWEPRPAARFAHEIGVVYAGDPLAIDPLADDPAVFEHLPGDAAYFTVTGLGRAQTRLDAMDLEALAELHGLYERVWTVFAHPGKYPDSILFQQMLESSGGAA